MSVVRVVNLNIIPQITDIASEQSYIAISIARKVWMRVTFFYLSTMRKKSSRHLILGGLVDRLDGFLETRPADELAVLLQGEPHDGPLPRVRCRSETDTIWAEISLVF